MQAFPDEPLQKHGGGNVNGGDEEGVAGEGEEALAESRQGHACKGLGPGGFMGIEKARLADGFHAASIEAIVVCSGPIRLS